MNRSHDGAPKVLIFTSSEDALRIERLFGRRGFDAVVTSSLAQLERERHGSEGAAAVAIVDLANGEAGAAVQALAGAEERPALVGILDGDWTLQERLDAAFERPVDPARLFVRVVELVSQRRGGRRPRMVTGVVGAIDGNDLFLAVARAMELAVPRVNAGAVLAAALHEVHSGPFIVGNRDVAALLASGQLGRAIARFGDEATRSAALRQVATLVRGATSTGEIPHRPAA